MGVAQRLGEWLSIGGGCQTRLAPVEEAEPRSIVAAVTRELNAVKPSSVALNYTGGTKAMSVHAYRTVEKWAREQQKPCSMSYLDARRLALVVDPNDPESGEQAAVHPLGTSVCPSLEDLLGLHHWSLKSPPTAAPVLPSVAEALARVANNKTGSAAWADWKSQVLYAQCKRNGSKWKSKSQLRDISLPLPEGHPLAEVAAELVAKLGALGCIALGTASDHCGFSQPEDFCKWLDGIWLEAATLQALLALRAELNLHDVSQNLEPRVGGGGPTHFELDVVAIRGYQLFAFSCSTVHRPGEAKQKLFEARERAQQLGGDEARIALVCCTDDPVGLEAEVRRDVDPPGRVRVFGREHLPDLVGRFRHWILEQSKGA